MAKASDLYIYYINSELPQFKDKQNLMEKKLSDIGLPYERLGVPAQDDATVNIVSRAHRDATILGLENDRFPILILEDDAELVSDFPFGLNICEDANVIYFGLSCYNSGHGHLKLENYNDEYYRVYNSLSTHGILIPTKKAAIYHIDLCDRSIEKSNWHDKELAYDSHKELFLTPKKGPIFFQTDPHTRPVTNFELDKFIID